MSRPRLVVSFALMAAVLVLSGRAVVGAVPLRQAATPQAPAGKIAVAPQPGQAAAKPAALRKLQDVRPSFPAGSAETPVILSLRIDPSGTVAETTTVEGPADLAGIAAAAARQWRFSPNAAETTVLVGFNPAAASADLGQPAVLVGGDVRPPAKIRDWKPVYPREAIDANAQGIVILELRMAADGSVAEARVLRSVPLLDRAAIDAVLKWKFTAAGFPVEMTVTVNFTLAGGPAPVSGGLSQGIAGGVAGGVRGGVGQGVGIGAGGGVAGGVAGGVTGGEQKAQWAELGNGERALRIGGPIKPPEKTYDVKPVYPKDAQDARVQGVVIIETMIGPDGKVKDAKIQRSVPLLDEAALEAVRQWEFTPTLLNGQAVAVIMTVTVNFRLE